MQLNMQAPGFPNKCVVDQLPAELNETSPTDVDEGTVWSFHVLKFNLITGSASLN